MKSYKLWQEEQIDEASSKKARNKAADEIQKIADKGGADAPALFSLASKLRKGTHSTTGLKLSKKVTSILKANGIKEGWFSKKEKEDPDQKELEKLGMKSAGRGGWDEKEQEKYNDLWMKMHKKGKTPTMSPPSVYGDDSWGTKTIKLQKKLKLTRRDHSGVLA